MPLPPPPIKDGQFPFSWQEWFKQVRDTVQSTSGAIAWASVNKSGSNLTDIVTRNHDSLQNIGGTGTSHISSTELTALTSSTQGTWTPTFTNLTVVNGTGGATYTGRYSRIGRTVFFTVNIVCTGTATTAATAGTTYHDLPVGAAYYDVSSAAHMTTWISIGGGVIDSATDRNYTPTWGATGNAIVISGKYEV